MSTDLFFQFSKEYRSFLGEIKSQIRSTQISAALAVNQEVIKLYWNIGKQIIDKQADTKWGSKFMETLSHDLQNAFPETHGFSTSNLKRMRRFAELYPKFEIGAQPVRQLPWGHIIVLIQRIKDDIARDWYAQQTIINGWSRYALEDQIKSDLYKRRGIPDNKVSNFLTRLPYPQSMLAQDILKSPYNLDCLALHDAAQEREIEHASIEHITKFLLEIGKGFSFVGRQVPIALQDEEYFIDILLYHLKLHSYCVVELKVTKFKPEHAGQLNFYLNLVDDFYKMPKDNPSIGLLLCKSRNKFTAEYALKGIEKPIGISEYQLTKAIPDKLKINLPTIEEIETELNEPKG
ncbi:MAG: hypothetical protein AMJ43_04750 [Coxiella sp. DG_40]|nr:MAG: hypothetical protein AMJ43_04750 [Coxiella sp. DG_40]